MNLTPWYPSKVNPVRRGVYEVRFRGSLTYRGSQYALWDGTTWGWASAIPDYAAEFPLLNYGPNQNKQWRGVMK